MLALGRISVPLLQFSPDIMTRVRSLFMFSKRRMALTTETLVQSDDKVFTYSFISVRQTQLLLCYNHLKDRVSISYDYMFRSFFDNLQFYKSYNLYILVVQLSVYLTNGIPLVLQFITVSHGLK
jgi:hypothetical protein